MDNVIICRTCGKKLIAEEEFTHKCQFDAIDIPVSDLFSIKKADYESVIGLGLNGKSYRFVKRLIAKPRGTSASDEIKHKDLSDEDAPEPVFGFWKHIETSKDFRSGSFLT